MTSGLFLLNAIAITTFAFTYISYYFDFDFIKLLRCRKMKKMKLVTEVAKIREELQRLHVPTETTETAVPLLYWRHPETGIAQTQVPTEIVKKEGGEAEGWIWTDGDGNEVWSKRAPQLVVALAKGEGSKPGDMICTLDPKTLLLSPLVEVPLDVMENREDYRLVMMFNSYHRDEHLSEGEYKYIYVPYCMMTAYSLLTFARMWCFQCITYV